MLAYGDDEQLADLAVMIADNLEAISVLDLPLPEPPPRGAQWIAAYRHWAGGL